MDIYQNKWAGNPTYFVRIHTSGRIMSGIGLTFCNDKWHIRWNDSYYINSPKENPERWPIVGHITNDDFVRLILSSIQ